MPLGAVHHLPRRGDQTASLRPDSKGVGVHPFGKEFLTPHEQRKEKIACLARMQKGVEKYPLLR